KKIASVLAFASQLHTKQRRPLRIYLRKRHFQASASGPERHSAREPGDAIRDVHLLRSKQWGPCSQNPSSLSFPKRRYPQPTSRGFFSHSFAFKRFSAETRERKADAPADALTTAALKGAEWRSGTSTPDALQASAVLMTAPRLCGSSTPSRTTTSGFTALNNEWKSE